MEPLKVLIGEHDGTAREVICRALGQRRLEVITAVDADRVVDLAEAARFDVAFLDVDIPPLGGLATWKLIRPMQPENLACVLTMDLVRTDQLHEAVLKGIFTYLCKPVDEEEVKWIVQRVMGRRH